MVAGTREWFDTEDVRDDLEIILGQLSDRQLRLVRRLSTPGPHGVARADVEEIRAVNWIAEAFWFRCPLLEVGPEGAVVAEPAREVVAAVLEAWLRRRSAA
ncbi:hypothetical protein [Amycolatopsis sp. NBC_00438]|uniref:hypothetical protein n=1 Tax=Amycolatopsis sp. NBC_00438 TaxID=2903558 RepID=UPI002E1B62C1